MEKKRLEWYASGKERVPGRLLIYLSIALTGISFALLAFIFYLVNPGAEWWRVLVGGLVGAVIVLAFTLLIWFLYTRLIAKK